jgi:multiple sugar transport system substrate-binding protein
MDDKKITILDDKKAISRRGYIAIAGAGVAAAAVGVGAYYLSGGPAPLPDKPEKLDFYQWDFGPPTVKKTLDVFTADTGIAVEQHVSPWTPYPESLVTKIIGGTSADGCYVGSGYRDKWYDAGWLLNLEDMSNVAQIKSELVPSLLSNFTDANGDLIVMPYYMAANAMPFYNSRLLDELGFEPATSREEVYEQCKAAKTRWDLVTPYYACYSELTHQFWEQYLVEDGLIPFDEAGNPMWEGATVFNEKMRWLKDMYDEGLMTPAIFTEGWEFQSVHMVKGDTLYLDAPHYIAEGVNRSMTGDVPEQGNMVLAPNFFGSSNEGVPIFEFMAIPKTTVSKEWAWELLKYLCWKDPDGEYQLLRDWATGAGLMEPYTEWQSDPLVETSFSEWIDFDLLMKFVNERFIYTHWWYNAWYGDWQIQSKDNLEKYILGELSLTDVGKRLADTALAAQANYA